MYFQKNTLHWVGESNEVSVKEKVGKGITLREFFEHILQIKFTAVKPIAGKWVAEITAMGSNLMTSA